MRTTTIIALVFLAMVIGGVLYLRHTSVYLGFKHKSTEYHAEFAGACDSLLAQHPPGTKEGIELSTGDPSMPGRLGILTNIAFCTLKTSFEVDLIVNCSFVHHGVCR